MLNTEERRAYYRSNYYKHHDRYRDSARERAAKKRAEPERPEDRTKRLEYLKNYNAQRRAERESEERRNLLALIPTEGPKLIVFNMILIGSLSARHESKLEWKRQWERAHYVPKPRTPKPPPTPKPIRIPKTEAEKAAAKLKYKREYEKRRLRDAAGNPEMLAKIRAHRRAGRERWLNKLKSDPQKYQEYTKRQSAKEKLYRWNNPQRQMACILRLQIYSALRRQIGARRSNNMKDLVGCSIEELRTHLQAQFQPGMAWNNFGRGAGKWSIDHIRPCASFNLCDEAQQKIAFHYTNLRPMWFTENCSKGSTHDGRKWKHSDHPLLPAVSS